MVSDNRHWFTDDRLQLFRPDQFGLLLSDLADSNKTDLSENLCLYLYFLDNRVYAHYGGVSNTNVIIVKGQIDPIENEIAPEIYKANEW